MSDEVRELLLEAGDLLKARYFDPPLCDVNARRELVTETDREIGRMIVERLRRLFPGDGVRGEDLGREQGQSGGTWIIDPIDGTSNYLMGKPYFAISMAREQRDKITEAYVYNPVSGELYHAGKGKKGAFLNGQRISPSPTTEIRDSLVAFGFSANMMAIQRYYDEWKPVFDQCAKGVGWITPAVTLCNVARGRLDAYFDFGASPAGQSSGGYILQKAGGIAMDYDSFDHYDYRTKGIVACGPGLVEALKKARK